MDNEELDAQFDLPRFPFQNSEPRVMFRKWTDYFPDGIDDEDEDDNDLFEDDVHHGVIVSHQVNGPFGTSNLPDINKLFNFVVCSTNFGITTKMFNELDGGVPGVESVDKISRYKIRIGIGELFNEIEVQRAVSAKLKECWEKQQG